jgi:hypothetical protein
MKAKK